MSDSTSKAASQYLSAPAGHFWRWSEDGEAIEWSNGGTIAFRAELRAVVDRLVPRGLPPLDGLLLVLGACRTQWPTQNELLCAIDLVLMRPAADRRALDANLYQRFQLIHNLSADVRESIEAKVELVDLLFEHNTFTPIVLPDVALQVRELLAANELVPREQKLAGHEYHARRQQSWKCFTHLVHVLDRVTPEILRLRGRTGLEQLPESAEIEVPEESSLREFLSSLTSDSELGGMARLARQLTAVVDLPRKIAEPDELSMGGISDIANRGALDRLLLSELAHDDLTLAVRVAVNEALYLRRESPPKSPPEQRAILIDAGLRLWGVPRVYAAAVALALAANSEQRASLDAWRAAGDGLVALQLRTRSGLIELLETLEHSLHPGNALPAFRDQLTRIGEDTEALLITNAETMADAEFQKALTENGPSPLYVATVERGGEFRLWHRSGHGKKLVREATLDLDQILSPPVEKKRQPPLIDPAQTTRLPAYLSVRPVPLRLPHRILDDNTWSFGPHAFLSLTNDGRLMLWDNRNRGAREIVSGLPRGTVAWGDPTNDGKHIGFLVLDRHERKMFYVTVELDGTGLQVHPIWLVAPPPLRSPLPTEFFRHGDALFCLGQGVGGNAYFRVIHTSTGAILHNGSLPVHLMPVGGRFFLSTAPSGAAQRVVTPVWNGSQVEITPVTVSGKLRDGKWLQELVRIFERTGVDGPLAVLRSGQVVQLIDGETRMLSQELATPIGVSHITADGARMFVRAGSGNPQYGNLSTGQGWFSVDYPSGEKQPTFTTRRLNLEGFFNFAWNRIVYRRFYGIYSDGTHLILTRRNGCRWKLRMGGGVPGIVVREGDSDKSPALHITPTRGDMLLSYVGRESQTPTNWAGFLPFDAPCRWPRLRLASLRDGSRVFLDSRGLFHLQSSDPAIPEMTLALSDFGVAGWIAGVGCWGHPFFLYGAPATPPRDVFEAFLKPFAARCV